MRTREDTVGKLGNEGATHVVNNKIVENLVATVSRTKRHAKMLKNP